MGRLWRWILLFIANALFFGLATLLMFGIVGWMPKYGWKRRSRDVGDNVILSVVLVFLVLCYISMCAHSASGQSRGRFRARVDVVGGQLVPTVRSLDREPFGRGRIVPALSREPPAWWSSGGAGGRRARVRGVPGQGGDRADGEVLAPVPALVPPAVRRPVAQRALDIDMPRLPSDVFAPLPAPMV
ncbi:hypothetical protein PR202_gb06730 [Eleusine coracana subsp. coracana]|uniref:Uncharacterized protein n=1 Tax=Eleusine coracana subsp. coracana TaxID=191504 RepID=A0AAV5EA79_ELECO|nr:hypothetical protein PR202_gb06730 [Eleusine coracana subsp. coracana]